MDEVTKGKSPTKKNAAAKTVKATIGKAGGGDDGMMLKELDQSPM